MGHDCAAAAEAHSIASAPAAAKRRVFMFEEFRENGAVCRRGMVYGRNSARLLRAHANVG
jgi:hypothetical protein